MTVATNSIITGSELHKLLTDCPWGTRKFGLPMFPGGVEHDQDGVTILVGGKPIDEAAMYEVSGNAVRRIEVAQ
jgi:hypothetical protein